MSLKQGFTTVEIMVTLIVAVLFILSGYQLYGMVSNRSSVTREMSEASNIGYEVLRKEGGVYQPISSPCATPTTQVITKTGLKLSNVTITIRRCKPFSDSEIIKVSVSVKYGTPQKEVVHATYLAS